MSLLLFLTKENERKILNQRPVDGGSPESFEMKV